MRCIRPQEAAAVPQEIDGKGGEIPPLCRNRDVPRPQRGWGAQSECQPAGELESRRRCTGYPAPTMKINTIAPPGGAFRVVPALVLAGCLSFAHAEEPAEIPEVELAPVTVYAFGGLAVPYDQTGVSVTVLDLPELKQSGIETLNEALTTVPGVAVQPGGLDQRGNTGNIAIRGMNRAQYTLPMVDGMRLYSFSDVNITPNVIARTDLFSLGRVELLRGSQGAVYGAGAIGGVVCMETPEGQGEPGGRLFNEAGSFGSYTGSAIAQGRVDKLSYFVSATYERTNNDIEFADGRPVTEKHAGHYEAWNEAVRLDYAFTPETRATFTYRREDAGYRYLSPVHPEWGGSCHDYSFRSNLLTARLESKLSERFSSGLMAGYYGLDNQLGEGYNLNLRNVQLEWRNLYRWCEHHSTTAGVAWNRSDYRCIAEYAGADMNDTLDNTYGFFAEHRYSPADNWDGSLALRWDQSSVWDGQFSFRAAGNYRFNGGETRAFASVGNGYKTPSALQRGGEYDAGYVTYVGNADLGCEQSLTVDAGIEHQLAEGHYLCTTLFWTRVEDGITPVSEGAFTTWENASGHWTSQGVELAAHGCWESRWNTGYRLAFTYTQPKDGEDGQLFQTARQQWTAEIHTSPAEGFTTGIGLTACVGRNDYNAIRLDNYCILRWFARYELNEKLSFHLRVENLTDSRFISNSTGHADQRGAILNSGAAVYGGCTLTF